MIDMFQYSFLMRAFIVGILLAVIIPCIGVVVVLKRLSMIGDAISHSSLAGVAFGLVIGINPTVGALIACVISALLIEIIRKRIGKFSELSIAVVMSAGIGLAGVLSGFSGAGKGFDQYLFGSIVSITDTEMWLVITLSVVVLSAFLLLSRALFCVSLDERLARLSGIPVRTVNFIFTVLTAVTVSVSARAVGALMVSSLMVIPVVCSLLYSGSFKRTVILSAVHGVLFTVIGLNLSYILNLKPGATIVLTGVIGLLIMLIFKGVFVRIKNKSR